MLTLDDYLLSCGGGDGGGRVTGNGDGSGSSGGSDGGCKWLWLLFIVVDILFYCDVYFILFYYVKN